MPATAEKLNLLLCCCLSSISFFLFLLSSPALVLTKASLGKSLLNTQCWQAFISFRVFPETPSLFLMLNLREGQLMLSSFKEFSSCL